MTFFLFSYSKPFKTYNQYENTCSYSESEMVTPRQSIITGERSAPLPVFGINPSITGANVVPATASAVHNQPNQLDGMLYAEQQ